jgi:hypothetical protein
MVAPVDGRTTMSSESVCQVARSWVDVSIIHTRLFGVVYFAIASFREFLDTPSYCRGEESGDSTTVRTYVTARGLIKRRNRFSF